MPQLLRVFFLALFCLHASAFALPTAAAETAKQKLKILMVINEGFWAPEYYIPRELFEKAGFQITVAGKAKLPLAPDKRNQGAAAVTPDLSFEDVRLADYQAITFAGGNGAWTDYFPNDTVHKLLAEALQRDMVTGLLCASTGLLGMAQNYNGQNVPLAKGRHVTGYFRVEGILRELGQVQFDPGNLQEPYAVIDKNLITGRDPISSETFAKAVIQVLHSRFAP